MRFGRCAAPKGPTQPGARDAPCRVATLGFQQLIPLFILAVFLGAGSAAVAQKGAQPSAPKPKAAPKAIIIKPSVPADTQITTTEVPKVAPGVKPVFPTATPDATPDATIVDPIAPTPGANAISTTTSRVTTAAPTSTQNAKKVSGAVDRYKQVDYWDEVRRREREKELQELRETEQKRAAVREAAPGLVKDGESIRPAPPVEAPVTAPPEPPSIIQNYRNHFLIGLAITLMGALTAYTLFRHRREKEIRILTGKYLSDGTEAAWIQMPHLFAGAPAATPHIGLDLSEKSGEKDDAPANVPAPDSPLTKFFKDAPNDLAEIRKLLPELSKQTDEEERKKTLFALYSLIDTLRTKAIGWDLRPVWQLSSALGLLVKRLAEKSKDATPTTIRTVATAIDLLSDLCVPGVRPDLIISPPIAVLAVDDDPLCLRAVMFALQKAEMTPDTAENGEGAVMLAGEKSYDVIFMDIKMPGIDGLRACEQIHELKKNENTPVVFVTSLSDFRTRAESTLAGGADLLIKPFLMFEITVKVLIFAMRKRLGLAASLKREVTSLTGASQLDGKAIAVLPAPHPAIPDDLDKVEAPATKEVSTRPEIPSASPLDGKAIAALSVPHPAIPVPLDEVEAAASKEGPVLPEIPAGVEVPVNGANGSHHATDAEDLSKPKRVYEGAELPALHMAPAAPLARENRVVPTIPAAEKDDRKTKKWLKRQKELASHGKFE